MICWSFTSTINVICVCWPVFVYLFIIDMLANNKTRSIDHQLIIKIRKLKEYRQSKETLKIQSRLEARLSCIYKTETNQDYIDDCNARCLTLRSLVRIWSMLIIKKRRFDPYNLAMIIIYRFWPLRTNVTPVRFFFFHSLVIT